jgi:hypothetical protein
MEIVDVWEKFDQENVQIDLDWIKLHFIIHGQVLPSWISLKKRMI